MPLTLRVSSYHGHAMGADGVRVIDNGATIGRLPSNDWILPDPERFVSGQHALISVDAGRYFLTDRSTNGTIVNGREMPRGGRVELRSGDRLTIGSYEIMVAIDSAPPFHAQGPLPQSATDDFFSDIHSAPSGLNDGSLDPLAALGGAGPQRPARSSPFGSLEDHAPPESAFFEPPRVSPDRLPQPNAGGIPENWSEIENSSWAAPVPAPSSTPTLNVSMHPAADVAGSDLGTLLRAAGIDPAAVDATKAGSVGEVLRVVVEGLMDVLKARAEIKNQFRVAMTTLKPVDNNPLKFSVDANDALNNLFCKRSPSFQSPVDAFRDAFDDLKAHQLAMMAGMRAAFADLMNRFDPDQLQEGFDRGMKRASILDVMNKTKYWDLYREMYASLGDDDTTFRRLFGDEFAQAYEEQMSRLSAVHKRR